MKAIDKIHSFINDLSEKTFYVYSGIALAIIFILAGGLIFHYYSNRASNRERIESINDQRTKVKKLLAKYELVKKHRSEVDAILTQDDGFKIGNYWNNLLSSLSLNDKKASKEEYPRGTHESKYEEIILRQKLTDMTMKQLCELLVKLDENKRIYTKELEITQSKQMQKKIDIMLTIATIEKLATA